MSTPSPQPYDPQEWSAYLDGELPAARRAAMRDHLRDCPSCAAVLRSFEAVQRGAESLAQQPAPAQPQRRTRLVAIGAAMIAQGRSRRRWLLWLSVVVSAVILAGLAAGLSSWTKNEGLLFFILVVLTRLILMTCTDGWKKSLARGNRQLD